MKKTKRFLFLLLALAVLLSGNCFASDQGTRPYNRYAEVEEIIDGERAEDPDDWVLTIYEDGSGTMENKYGYGVSFAADPYAGLLYATDSGDELAFTMDGDSASVFPDPWYEIVFTIEERGLNGVSGTDSVTGESASHSFPAVTGSTYYLAALAGCAKGAVTVNNRVNDVHYDVVGGGGTIYGAQGTDGFYNSP